MDSLAHIAPFQAQAIPPFMSPFMAIPSAGRQESGAAFDPPRHHTGGLAPWQVKRVWAYVDNHLAERMPLEVVAAVVRLSVSHFSRNFSKSLGLPFGQFLAQRRVAHAQDLMATTDRRLCDIALTCGFADQSHFSRTFSRFVGVSPARWRRWIGFRTAAIAS